MQATPNMSIADIANIINDLGRQLEAENRTKVMRDEDGTDRIIFGKTPNGEWVLAISAKGVNVLDALGQ